MPDRADVLVIGSGASGAVVSRHLAERGFRVVCLEQGHWVNASEYPGQRPEWELELSQRWHHDPNLRRRADDYPVDVTDAEILPQMFAGVGGSTLHFGGHFPRLLPSDFRVRTLDGVGDDWPISYADLLPYYERTDRDLGVAGLGGDPALPPGAPPPLPPHPINAYGRKAAEGMNALGWHWWPAPNAIASRDYGNLQRCARYGTCETGCPHGAKASVDLTHWPEAIKHGARLVTGARVREVTVDARGRARGAIYRDRDRRRAPPGGRRRRAGRERRRHAAADAAVDARRSIPTGLANSSGLVGPAPDAASDRRRGRRATTTTSRRGRARPASRSTRSSSTTPTPTAASCAAPSGR